MEFRSLTPDRWSDLVRLFEHHGNPGYCWCTYWRLPSREYSRSDRSARRQAMQALVASAVPVGILAYQGDTPVAWCSIAPRETYLRLEQSTSIPRIDDQPTWSIVCFYLDRSVRRQNLSLGLLQAALEYARDQGAQIVEAYPVEPKIGEGGKPDYKVNYRFMGFMSTFLKAGFQDATPPGSQRRVMRYRLSQSGQ